MSSNVKKIRLRQVKSSIGSIPKHRSTLIGLGLRNIGSTVELDDTPSIRGMVNKVKHLVVLEG